MKFLNNRQVNISGVSYPCVSLKAFARRHPFLRLWSQL